MMAAIVNNPLNDAEKARRFQRKLEDLWKASGDFVSNLLPSAFTKEARPSYERLSDERFIIRQQLDILAMAEKSGATEDASPDLLAVCLWLDRYDRFSSKSTSEIDEELASEALDKAVAASRSAVSKLSGAGLGDTNDTSEGSSTRSLK
jgi:hypothetical protein